MKEGICKSRFCSIEGNSRKELGVFSINLSSEASEVESYQQHPKESHFQDAEKGVCLTSGCDVDG